jgi:hypothetical protein
MNADGRLHDPAGFIPPFTPENSRLTPWYGELYEPEGVCGFCREKRNDSYFKTKISQHFKPKELPDMRCRNINPYSSSFLVTTLRVPVTKF